MDQPYIHVVHVISQSADDPSKAIIISDDSDGRTRYRTLPADHPAVSAAAWCLAEPVQQTTGGPPLSALGAVSAAAPRPTGTGPRRQNSAESRSVFGYGQTVFGYGQGQGAEGRAPRGPGRAGRPAPRPLSRDDLLTVAEAARELGFRRSEAESWLRREGLLVSVCGRERVVWGSVLDAITGPPCGAPVQEPPRSSVPIPVDEALLTSWQADAPKGSGSRRSR